MSSPQYRGSYNPQYYYPNGSRPPKYEMSEFTANAYMNGKNGNSRVGPMPTNGSSYNGTKMSTVPVEDEELDRGHWGSKAEFILSCIGFSVSLFFKTCNQ